MARGGPWPGEGLGQGPGEEGLARGGPWPGAWGEGLGQGPGGRARDGVVGGGGGAFILVANRKIRDGGEKIADMIRHSWDATVVDLRASSRYPVMAE